jgi:hypothetical protein
MGHVVAGYDPRSELIREEHPVPAAALEAVKALAGVPPDDPEAVGIYWLGPDQAARIAAVLGIAIDPHALLWYLEP